MAYRRMGVGIYPGDPCFDPGRPAWLPYWFDTTNESGCKFGAYPTVKSLAPSQPIAYTPDVATATTPGLPVGYDPTTGVILGNVTGATQVRDYAAAIAGAMPDNPSCPPEGCPAEGGIPWWVWAVGAGLLVLAVVK